LQPPAQARARSDDGWRSEVDALPPGLRKRDVLPPGLRKRDELPPGLRKRDVLQPSLHKRVELPLGLRNDFDGRARKWRGRVATNVPMHNPIGSSSPVPEPSGFLLFRVGLLAAGVIARRR
jgi:hypothetical protein